MALSMTPSGKVIFGFGSSNSVLRLSLLALMMLSFVCVHAQGDDQHTNMSPEELEAELKKVHEEVEKLRQEHNDVFTNGDRDKDGKMSPEEFFAVQRQDDPTIEQKDLEEAFSDHDKDGSGSLSLPEWQEPFEETVRSMLSDGEVGDGMTEEERIAHHRQEFNQYDSNADGFLDEAELDVLAKQVSAQAGSAGHENGVVTGVEVLHALDIDADSKVSFEEYVLDGATQQEGEYGDPDELAANDLSLDDITGDGDLS